MAFVGSSRLAAGRGSLLLLWVSSSLDGVSGREGAGCFFPGFMCNLMPHQMESSATGRPCSRSTRSLMCVIAVFFFFFFK